MNIRNVQIQSFLERVQAKVMRRIEDEYYCGGCAFDSVEQLDQFKTVWAQKLKQHFATQNNQQFIGVKRQNEKIEENQLKKKIKKEEVQKENEEELNEIQAESKVDKNEDKEEKQIESQQLHKQDIKKEEKNEEKQEIKEGNQANLQMQLPQNLNSGLFNDNINYLQAFNDEQLQQQQFLGNEETGKEEMDSQQDDQIDFSLDEEDLKDINEQIIDENYFQGFENYLFGFAFQERKSKKKRDEETPVKSLHFTRLVGKINDQEVLISSLHARLVDTRK